MTFTAQSRGPSASAMYAYLDEDDRTAMRHPADAWRRYPSPASSGDSQEPTDTGCGFVNSHRSPRIFSVDVSCSGQYDGDFGYALDGLGLPERHEPHVDASCVALHEIQKTADDQTEYIAPDDASFFTYSGYGMNAQEGYQVECERGSQAMSYEDDTTSYRTPNSDYLPATADTRRSEEPVIRRRRGPSVGVTSGRIRKRLRVGKRASSFQDTKQEHGLDEHDGPESSNRAFPCPLAIYGCTSAFSAKNEWKRHVSTQHLRLGYWRCEQCAASGERNDGKPNDFNRKDLFMQHVRRMHPPTRLSCTKNESRNKSRGDGPDEQHLRRAAEQCYRHLRDAPESSSCVLCGHHFHGPGSWEERMEHIGRHMDATKRHRQAPVRPHAWRRDEEVEMWLLQARIIEYRGTHLTLADVVCGQGRSASQMSTPLEV